MNLLAIIASYEVKNEVYNVAVGYRTTLNDFFHALQSALSENGKPYASQPVYRDFRAGNVRHSQADIIKVASKLDYEPEYKVMDSIAKRMPLYISHM